MFYNLKFKIFKLIVRRMVVQSHMHNNNIESMFKEIHNACQEEFTEDSPNSLKAYLQERFSASITN